MGKFSFPVSVHQSDQSCEDVRSNLLVDVAKSTQIMAGS